MLMGFKAGLSSRESPIVLFKPCNGRYLVVALLVSGLGLSTGFPFRLKKVVSSTWMVNRDVQ